MAIANDKFTALSTGEVLVQIDGEWRNGVAPQAILSGVPSQIWGIIHFTLNQDGLFAQLIHLSANSLLVESLFRLIIPPHLCFVFESMNTTIAR